MNVFARIACFLLCCSVLLTGCWDIKSVSDYNFVTALGIDYKKGQYIVYTELVDYEVAGKHNLGSEQLRPNVWVGKSEGKTVYEAMTRLYDSVQQYMYWDHIMAIVLSDSVMKQDIHRVTDAIGRFSQIRFNSWVFGTREPIDKLFKQSTFFNVSPIATLLHNPDGTNNQRTIIPPIRLLDVYSNRMEPGQSNLIPKVNITKNTWEDTEKPQPTLIMSGAYALRKGRMAVRFEQNQLGGIRWSDSGMKKSFLRLHQGDQQIGMISLFNLKKKISVASEGSNPTFTMSLSYKGIVEEVLTDTTLHEILEETVKTVRKEILQTYQNGAAAGTDLYGLEQVMYRKHPKLWKQATNGGQVPMQLTDKTLSKVDVHIDFMHAGASDLKP
ncbi:Ger(x)C family spore germination protein [Paenibacillus pasadenensis]|uniref:Ger(x)C family spore germination protein n=1 Tax=Paenibacillus pasadenensis TaxID=217090 RepID=UPI00203C15AF|nr:Ger(x)C family spore germination protein [Paenibacillus pasadenensis]MCM3746093.1 Ger(x)C family spore germination protein [Paenibacillus pasadenensis]